jgi:hypothetical protein
VKSFSLKEEVMAKWTKVPDIADSVTLPLTINSDTAVSTRWIFTEQNNTLFFRWYLENTKTTGSNGMEVEVSLISVYDGEMLTLASVAKSVDTGESDELIVQFSPNVPGGTVASQNDRIQLGMGNPNYLGEKTFTILKFAKQSPATGAGSDPGIIKKVDCYILQE